ncbi:MAG TPA: pilus assembly protein TadG-related protein [Terriglobales bacterium]
MSRLHNPSASKQQGQTLALVAISMVSLLAVAALAVDLASLYAARGEIQRAADAAALAGAKAFVDSGVTTDPANATLQNIAETLAQAYANGAAAQNPVSGSAPQFPSPPTFDFTTYPGNPRITVTLQRTGLPLFFARIWGGQFSSVSASAVAEAYNPSYSQSNTTAFVPAAPRCVKPLLIPNNDSAPGSNAPLYVDPASGAPEPSALNLVGGKLPLVSACKFGGNGCTLRNGETAPRKWQYLPLQVSGPHQYCPAASQPGCSAAVSDFQESIQCCDGSAFNFAQCSSSVTPATWDPSINPNRGGGPVQNGLQCLMHADSTNTQQDTIDPSNFTSGNGPVLISPGPFSQARYGLQATDLMATSDSIITVPLFDNSNPELPANVTIVGFLELFVTDVGTGAQSGDLGTILLNISGCGRAAGAGAISGGGVSAIPVRLIRQ